MAGNLIQPRVRVSWAGINLSSYDGPGDFPKETPAVYDVEVQLQSQTQAPTASMKWDPTGPGFSLYESFISNPDYMKSRIFIDFFYAGGKRIRMAFVWSGQSISYGNDMTVTVKMKTELDGMINGNIRSNGQAHDEKKGESYLNALKKLQTQYSIQENLLRYEPKAKTSMEKATIQSAYGNDQTYGAAVANVVQQNGNTVFANNIGEPNLVVFAPFSWKPEQNTVLNGVTELPPGTDPKPDQRYGYIVGPSIIDSLVRETEWRPPQQTKQNNPSTQAKARNSKTARSTQQNPATSAQVRLTNSTRPGSSPQGTANARANPGISNVYNPDGPTKQNFLEDERTASMTFQTMLCPALVGIKPYDVVYIPSFGKIDPETKKYVYFTEDWIVESVSYDQNDGNVSVSVQGTREYGLGTPMDKKNAEKFEKYAIEQGLIGPNATLDNWDRYAWSLSPGTTRSQDTLSNGEYNPRAAAQFRASGDSFN
jgi:hypothetical protein